MAPDYRTRRLLDPDRFNPENEIERPKRILTRDDRKYIVYGPGDRSESAIEGKERRMRRRTREGLLDFALLANHFGPDDRVKVIDPHGSANETDSEVQGSISFLLSFIYNGYCDAGLDFERALCEAVYDAERQNGLILDDGYPRFERGPGTPIEKAWTDLEVPLTYDS